MQLNEEQLKAVTHPQGEAALLLAGAGSGKCLGPEVPVLLYDGSIKQAQHVRNGDMLIGPDGLPRMVSGTTSGVEEMFEITPVKGDTWTCNRSHILSLYVSSAHKQKTYGELVEMTVDAYLAKSDSFKRKVVKQWRAPLIEYALNPVSVNPWFLGLWLGDGKSCLDTTSVYTVDLPVVDALRPIAESYGLVVTQTGSNKEKCPKYTWALPNGRSSQTGRGRYAKNPLSQQMRDLGLHQNKHIPMVYLRNTANIRRSILAGLIDSDGHMQRGCVQIATKFPQLCRDILWLARSLGLAAYSRIKSVKINGKTKLYEIISISGDMSTLPVVLKRKICGTRKQIKSVRVTGFKVRSIGYGQYNGFKVDRDGLFLLGDFTVTHNTAALTERIAWLIEQGVPSRRILALTFTNKAAGEIRERVLKRTGLGEESAPRLTTIHSLALSFIRKNPAGFGLDAKVSPLADYDQIELLKKILQRLGDKAPDINPFALRDKISYHRARGTAFSKFYTDEVHENALKHHSGYHAMVPSEVEIWSLFEEEKRSQSVVDFDDMLAFVNLRMREDTEWAGKVQKLFLHVLMDEAQDTSACHPPGTMIKVVTGYKRTRGTSVAMGEVPIEYLRENDTVVPWSRRWGRLFKEGRPVTKISCRPFKGNLIRVTCGENSVSMTPDHKVYATLTPGKEQVFLVYLMYRQDLGFRVGQCSLQYARSGVTGKARQNGLVFRSIEEKAERAWILRTTTDKQQSRAWEQIYSCRYGIPYAQFEASNGKKHEELLATVFQHCNGDGMRCLADHNLLFKYPLFQRKLLSSGKLAPTQRYFETYAANLRPGIMSLPGTEDCSQTPITRIEHVPYNGPVYSMDVADFHTYVANGIVVRNCAWEFVNHLVGEDHRNLMCVGDLGQSIYGFTGAAPDLILNYSKEWRGSPPTLYKLQRNHRSVPEVVKLANAIQSKFTATLPLTMQSFRGEQGETGATRIMRRQDPVDLAARIAQEIVGSGRSYKDFAILIRAGSQVREIEGELIRLRIPYIVRGGKGLLQTEEVRDVLSYIRLATNPKDFSALSRALAAPKRGLGDAALEAIRKRAKDGFEGDLVKAAFAMGGKYTSFADILQVMQRYVHDPVNALDKCLGFIDYRGHLRKKYAKEPEKVEVKIENLTRLQDMIQGLSADTEMSAADLIFQLTMDKSEVMDERGAVTISTIHSMKGLEAPVVFVFNVVEGMLPSKFSTTEADIEEERRLFYVAVTRARDILYLTVARTLQVGRNLAGAAPSRFLTELGIE